DLREETQVERLIEGAAARHGRLDALINNAAVGHIRPVAEGRSEEWRAVLETNVLGTLVACRAALRHMLPRGAGDIVNITSAPALARELGGWRGRHRRLRCAREGRAEERAAAGEPAEMRLRLAERGLVSEPPGDRRAGPSGLLADEREVAVILDLLSLELGQDRGVPATLGGQQADQDLVAQGRRPGRT